jgi:hypothetical protein
MVALNPDVPKAIRNKSAGYVLPNLETKIEDKDDEGDEDDAATFVHSFDAAAAAALAAFS